MTPTDAPINNTAPQSRLLKSDWFTILLHWGTVIAMVLSLATGLRIGEDTLGAVLARYFRPILPQGDMWEVHFYSALAFFAFATAYVIYLYVGKLRGRNSLKKLNVLSMPAPAKMKWGALNVALHWLFYIMLLALMVTGVFMYLGNGNWMIEIHRAVAIGCVAYLFAHIIAHFMYGGWYQLLRVFVPSALKINGQPAKAPAFVSLLIALPITAALAGIDLKTRDTLRAVKVEQAPDMTKLLEDPAWKASKAALIGTNHGANLGGTGESKVEVRAVHDGSTMYFAFRWEDPTPSVHRLPVIKQADGWHLIGTKADIADVTDFYEDKFAVLFTKTEEFAIGAATHMGHKPLADKPGPLHGRGLHYTTDGSFAEMWQWKATRGGMTGGMDHQYIGPPRDATPGEAAGRDRYQAGYWNYEGGAPYVYNYVGEGPGGYKGPVKLRFLPKDLAATQQAMGPLPDPAKGISENQRFWMFERETIPYSAEEDAKIPVGTVIPGVILKGNGEYTGERGLVKVHAKWADGHWTLVAKRSMKPEGKYDHSFVPGSQLYLWFAVYDRTQTRHSRHSRPLHFSVQ